MGAVRALPQSPGWQLVANYLSPIAPWFEVDGVSEIMVNHARSVFIERSGITYQADSLADTLGFSVGHWRDESHLLAAIESIGNALGQPIDRDHPILDARLATGERINAVIPPVACDGCVLTIRLFPPCRFTLTDLAARATFSRMPDAEAWLQAAVRSGKTGIVTGAMRSGKTTLLGALIAEIEHDRRLVVVEDTRELYLEGDNVARGEAARRDQGGSVTLHTLLRNAMRQSPHTIVVGEIRDGLAATVALEAMQLGHPVLTTMHAPSAQTALRRLTKLALRQESQIPYAELRTEILDAIDFIAHMALQPDGTRKLTELLDVSALRDD